MQVTSLVPMKSIIGAMMCLGYISFRVMYAICSLRFQVAMQTYANYAQCYKLKIAVAYFG